MRERGGIPAHDMKPTTPFAWMVCAALAMTARAETIEQFINTAFGWLPHPMHKTETGSLQPAMEPGEQMSRRYAGVPTSAEVLRQTRRGDETAPLCGWTLLPAKPQHFMPYLDSIFVPGNTCIEPCRFIGQDGVSAAAQKIKAGLSRIGLQYDLTLSAEYAGIAPRTRGRRNEFVSSNNSVTGTWFLLKKSDGSQGLFLTFEADWGPGINFNERKSSVQGSLGSLSNPQGCLRGGNGVYIPNLALGYSLFKGKWLGMAGTLDTSNYLDQNAYSASWNGNLMNESFNLNPCLPLESANWGYLTAWQPHKNFYAMYATTGCNGKTNHNPFPYISRDAWVHISEFGYICEDFFGLGAGTYRFQYTITRYKGETGSGAALNIQQQLGRESRLGFFTRCGFMDEDAATVSTVRATATAGLVLQAPFRSHGWGSAANNDQIAFGFLWERAAESEKPFVHHDEYGLELTAVVQLTPTFYLQPDVQYIFNPVQQTDRSGAFVFQLQGVFKF